jgi:hypothetical protein
MCESANPNRKKKNLFKSSSKDGGGNQKIKKPQKTINNIHKIIISG